MPSGYRPNGIVHPTNGHISKYPIHFAYIRPLGRFWSFRDLRVRRCWPKSVLCRLWVVSVLKGGATKFFKILKKIKNFKFLKFSKIWRFLVQYVFKLFSKCTSSKKQRLLTFLRWWSLENSTGVMWESPRNLPQKINIRLRAAAKKREKPVHQLRVHRGTQSVPFDRGAEGVAASACYWNSSPNRSSARALHVKRPAPRDGIWLEVIVFMGFKNFVRLS